MSAVSPARKAAFQILMALDRGQGHSDDLLRGKGVSELPAADRSLTTALVLGVLRWQIGLDHQIQSFLKRPNARLDTEVRIALRMGAFQLRHMDRIPARAAIDESVEIAKQAGHHFASGMANAVLRKIAADLPSDQAAEGTAAELALAQAHPLWMVERWVDFYGIEAARAICHHGQSQPMRSVRIVNKAAEEEIAAAGIVLDPGELLAPARSVTAGEVTATSAFHEGRVRLQDEGSQFIAELAGQGEMILDCCAAPGGKTLILAERNPNAHIVACEASPQRLRQLSERLRPLGSRLECRLADAAALTDENVYDLALADVPCSGTGTLGRNPEIRHRLRPEDLMRQAERQMAILRTALRAVRPGGYVVYSTCSLEPEENEDVVAAVLAEMSGARVAPMHAGVKALLDEGILKASGADGLRGCITGQGFLRLLPGAFHTDGFFVAILEKAAT